MSEKIYDLEVADDAREYLQLVEAHGGLKFDVGVPLSAFTDTQAMDLAKRIHFFLALPKQPAQVH